MKILPFFRPRPRPTPATVPVHTDDGPPPWHRNAKPDPWPPQPELAYYAKKPRPLDETDVLVSLSTSNRLKLARLMRAGCGEMRWAA